MSPLKKGEAGILENPFIVKLQTAMMGLCTSLIIGCFGFLWNINATISAQAVEIQNGKDNVTDLKNTVDFLRVTASQHADRITKLELKKN